MRYTSLIKTKSGEYFKSEGSPRTDTDPQFCTGRCLEYNAYQLACPIPTGLLDPLAHNNPRALHAIPRVENRPTQRWDR